MRLAAFIVCTVLATGASAQEAIVTSDAPIYVKPGATVPLRTAAVGTLLRVVGQEGEWVQVQFNDPRWGLRTGWVRADSLELGPDERMPMDLSVRPVSPPARQLAQPSAATAQPASPATSYAHPRTSGRAWLRNHVVGRSGITFGTATAGLAGVEMSGDVLPVLQVYGAFDWHEDVLPKDIRNAFSLIGDAIGVSLELKAPTYVGMGGAKVILPPNVVRPYGMGGFGVAHTNGKVLLEGEDQTQLVLGLAGLEKSDISFTKPIMEFGGGVVIPAGRAYFDVGYRFRKVLDADGINVSGIYVGGGFSY